MNTLEEPEKFKLPWKLFFFFYPIQVVYITLSTEIFLRRKWSIWTRTHLRLYVPAQTSRKLPFNCDLCQTENSYSDDSFSLSVTLCIRKYKKITEKKAKNKENLQKTGNHVWMLYGLNVKRENVPSEFNFHRKFNWNLWH